MYQRAMDLRPAYWENYNRVGYFYLQIGNFQQAERMYRKVIELRPESPIGFSNLAGTLILAGKSQQAVPLLQAALRINPTVEGYINLGFVYYSGGQYDLAAQEWQRAIDLAPEDAGAYANLGDAYRHLGNLDEARTAYGRAIDLNQKALQVNANQVEARISLSIALAGIGRCDQAREQAAQAITAEPKSPTNHYYVALAYAVCGDRAEALRHTAAAIKGGALSDVRSNPDLKRLLKDPGIQGLLANASAGPLKPSGP
jgi:Flp pilus assembly protein TadD